MSKSFVQAPKPPLSAEVISAFERGGAGQDTRGRLPSIVETGEPTNVGAAASMTGAHVERLKPTDVEMGAPTDEALRVPTKLGKAERTRRLSIDLPESWHKRFKIACTRADKKMIEEVSEFIKRRTLELEQE